MTEVSYLVKQTKDVYDWTSRFLKTILFDKDLDAALNQRVFLIRRQELSGKRSSGTFIIPCIIAGRSGF
ncbi:MAG: hypothetical protein J7527_10285 [Chitinophagaceae bacterium]|nr:hypothetical protein [Chitinophagaceae bacterium]